MDRERYHHHLWQYRWVRDLLVLGALYLVWQMVYTARGVTVPMLVGLALAYAVQPLVIMAERWIRLPRWAVAAIVLVLLVGGVAGALVYVLPLLYEQARALVQNLPRYLDQWLGPLGFEWAEVKREAKATAATALDGDAAGSGQLPTDLRAIGTLLWRWLGVGLGVVSSVLNTTFYALLVFLIVGFTFVYFSWRFDQIVAWFDRLIPPSRHAAVVRIIRRMDHSVAGALRGRLLQATILAAELCIGWYFVGVRYWLLLGILGGVLNIVPYASMVGWPVVVALHWADTASSGEPYELWWVVLGPTIVHAAGQFIDGWVVEPLVQGRATNLDALTVLMAVLIGGSLFGVFGMLMAVPIAACIKILGEETLVPWLKEYLRSVAGEQQPPPGP